ncbi:MAG: histidine kinase [Flavobacteriaceae bacterium]|nr:histidine kinase [Flavobacteriaceae bacterium]
MFKRVLKNIFIIFLFLFGITHAQEDIENVQLPQPDSKTTGFTAFGVSPEKANDTLLKKIKNATNFDDRGDAIIQLANFHIEKGNTDSISFYGNYLFNESLKTDKNYFLSVAANIIAIGKRKEGLIDEALKWHIKGVGYAENLTDKHLFYTHKFGIGIIHFLRKEYIEAIDLYNECLNNTLNIKFEYDIYKRLGDIYLAQGNLIDAQKEYTKAVTFYKSNSNSKEQLITEVQLGIIDEELKNYSTAFNYYNSVKDEALTRGFYDLYFKAQNKIGGLYFILKQYDNAHLALSTAYINAIQWNNLEYQKTILQNTRRVYLAQEDYKNAYNVMTQYLNISNRIQQNQNKKEINELEVQYNTLQKENQIHLLEKEQIKKEIEINRQKELKINLLIGFLVILIPVVAILYMYYQKLQTQSKLNKIQEEVNQQKVSGLLKDQELELIKADIEGQDKERKRIAQELHDSIGGNLASIKLQLSNTAKDNENYRLITKQIDDTYNQVRDLSHNLTPKKFNENAFTTLVSQYIKNIEKDNKTNITFSPHPEKEVNAIAEKLKVELYKIIQELLTNTFKHANANQIDIHLNKLDNTLKLLFEDDGDGFNVQNSKKGVGLNNIKSRLDVLSGTMNIDSLPNRGTVIDIDIPI